MKEKFKIILLSIVAVVLVVLIGLVVANYVKATNYDVQNPVATFEIRDYGNVKIELYPEYAPNTVSNIIALINSGYYNEKVVYGKDEGAVYMARTADDSSEAPKVSLVDKSVAEDSENNYEYEINGEFIANGFEKNTLRHEKGIVSLNRSDYSTYGLKEEGYNSGSAQFSVIMQDSSNLNGLYCGFGKVIEGMEIIEKIYNEAEIATAENEENVSSSIKEFSAKPVIANATVDTFGVEYGKPEVHKAFDLQSYLMQYYSSYYSY